ncbi:unnamed protein product [Caenorhabditis auriculariae]|uniref:ZP domain-containing protein n=1 Tax=Caenorhabditis auriculariae TaxID=2777116 RepID=A0A8S1H7N9_9PELO|nr:unnamed protein product [Caenorhabditis auriculariae]
MESNISIGLYWYVDWVNKYAQHPPQTQSDLPVPTSVLTAIGLTPAWRWQIAEGPRIATAYHLLSCRPARILLPTGVQLFLTSSGPLLSSRYKMKSKPRVVIFLIILGKIICQQHQKDGFVEEVSCSSDNLVVIINSTDPDVVKWIADPKSQPVVYVYGHKTRHPCGTSMKNEKGLTNYNLTIPFGKECDVPLIDLQPDHQTAETTIALEDNADLSYFKTVRLNHVFCLYTRNVQTMRFNDVSNGHEVMASTGGKPKPKVEMVFRSVDGKSLRAAKVGETVELFLALWPDAAYHGIKPKECVFSDREDINSPDARRLTFVQSGCPFEGFGDIIDPLANVNDQVYFSKFKTFRFSEQSTVFVHCIVQVCLRKEECSENCYKKVTNSSLNADRLRFRHRRSPKEQMALDPTSELTLSNTLTILDENTPSTSSSLARAQETEPCRSESGAFSKEALLIIGITLALLVASTCATIYLANRLRQASKDSFDVMSAYSNSTATMSVPISYAMQRTPYGSNSMEHYR